ncbi:uncharacterized protein LOC107036875 [Diachasma alloeum]|uniref:uncharacterized protein LOC107036875 n=1 Tax=Diachasma alloeum TaxID=454923 RepID=UPI0007383C91|nr:uncharacterized protein LOC107036875 [Diachasma alloeum]
MITKLFVFILVCGIAWIGAFVDARPPIICRGPPRYNTPSQHQPYVRELERRGFINEEGVIDKTKIDEFFIVKSEHAERALKIISGYKQCADEVMDSQITDNKYEDYLKCLNNNENAKLLFEKM